MLNAGAFVVPPIVAAKNRDPVVRQLIHVAARWYQHRSELAQPMIDRWGTELLPAWPEILERIPLRQGPKESIEDFEQRCADEPTEDFEQRRADGMQGFLAMFVAVFFCCNWRSMKLIDYRNGGPVSVERLAELADLTLSRAERALAVLRHVGIITFTKQWREKLDDGRHVSTGPALRRAGLDFLKKIGWYVWKLLLARRAGFKEEDAAAAKAARLAGQGADLRIRREARRLAAVKSIPSGQVSSRAQDDTWPRPQSTPIEVTDAIADEHPTWGAAEIMAEALRRRRPPDTS